MQKIKQIKNRKNKTGNQKEGCGAETTGVFRMDPLSASRRSGSSSERGKIPITKNSTASMKKAAELAAFFSEARSN
jgi:hypothetical protein